MRKSLRSKRAVKRLDMAELRHLLRDRRMWCGLGVVTAPDDGGAHYELHEENGVIVDITIEVLIAMDKLDLTCRLSGIGASAGMITIPDVGDEVVVALPAGEIDFMPVVVGQLSRAGALASGAQGPAPQRVVVVGAAVLVHDGSGGAKELAYKTDVEAVLDYVRSDLELTVIGGGGGTAKGAIDVVAPGLIEGTEVLKAK